jgi:chromosome partitioning protein
MSQIIAIGNGKGGVGKTTTAINLGAALSDIGQRTLLIDLDPQHGLTKAMGIEAGQVETGSFTLFKKGAAKPRVFKSGNLAVLPTRLELSTVNFEMATKATGNATLRKALADYSGEYDFIIIDNSPNLDLLSLNSLVAAHWVIMPCQCQYMALEALGLFLETVEEVREINPQLAVLAVLPMAYNANRKHEKEALEVLKERFGNLCVEPVPYRTEYPNATADHRPVSGEQFNYWKRFAQNIVKTAERGASVVG